MHSLAECVLSHIRRQELLRAGDRVGVAVSGGIDSVALLRLLLELRDEVGFVLSVVHFNHKLRGAESDADQEFVQALAREHGLEFFIDSGDVRQRAADEGISLEAAARDMRYEFFQRLIPLEKIATGHTLDDQAETVLMRAVRGSGLRGLGGIYPRLTLDEHGEDLPVEIVRPLLGIRRRKLEQFLNDIAQNWREDATNQDTSYTRNRVRRLVLPLIEKELNPAVAENLAELAEIARGEEDYWENEIAGWMGTAVQWQPPDWVRALSGPAVSGSNRLVQIAMPRAATAIAANIDDLTGLIDSAPWLVMNASVGLAWFLSEPLAVQRRLVKAIADEAGIPLEFKHVDEILRFAADATSSKQLSLPLGWKIARQREALAFLTPDLRHQTPVADYEYDLLVPGQTVVPELGVALLAQRISQNQAAEYNPEHLLNPESLTGPLKVRNWRPGDRFWPAHTKSSKKIKELLQEHHIAGTERRLWPLVVRAWPGYRGYAERAGRTIRLFRLVPTGSATRGG